MPKKICVIDDEQGILDELSDWLGEQGYDVMTSNNGDVGLEMMAKNKPHLLILDLIMPKVDGFEVLSRMKQDPQTANVPVIMLTAKKDTASIMEAQERRACDFMTKPFLGDELLRSIQRYIL